jgi:hypothetical protein
MGEDLLDDLVADPVDGVERGHRVLEDHRDPLPADPAKLLVARICELLVAEDNRALDPSVRRPRQPHQGLGGDALATSGLADDRDHLASVDLERHSIDRLEEAVLGLEPDLELANPKQAHWYLILGSR